MSTSELFCEINQTPFIPSNRQPQNAWSRHRWRWTRIADQPDRHESWLFRYCLQGREHRIGLGPPHTVGLAEAREKARQARLLILGGRDPS